MKLISLHKDVQKQAKMEKESDEFISFEQYSNVSIVEQ